MFSIETISRPATVDGFTVTLTPIQMQYITAVIGATVVSGSIPQECRGMYTEFCDALAKAGLVDPDWLRDFDEALVNADGVPYANRLFQHLGLRGIVPQSA